MADEGGITHFVECDGRGCQSEPSLTVPAPLTHPTVKLESDIVSSYPRHLLLFVFIIEHKDTDILGIIVKSTPNIQILYELRASLSASPVFLR